MNKSEISCFGINFSGLTKKEILQLEKGQLKLLATINSEFIVKANTDRSFHNILSNFTCCFDGQVPYFLARLRNLNQRFEKVSGSEICYDIFELCKKRGMSVFFLGGNTGSNERAVDWVKTHYSISVDGYSPPFSDYPFSSTINEQISQALLDSAPDFVFVGFGAGKQERWIWDNRKVLQRAGVKLAVGSGGTVDFIAGKFLRAPRILQKVGFEGIYRLIQEPSMKRVSRLLTSFKVFLYYFFPKNWR